jgi:TM2 domain-containing membrane protein YozV
MFCRNCGKELRGSLEFCKNCGAKPMAGTSFCPGCGAPTTPLAEICVKCGTRIAKELAGGISPKSRLATTLLAFFLGVFGAHRFYVGKTESASLMLFLGIFGLATILATIWLPLNVEWFFVGVSFIIAVGIWAFVDFIFAVIGRMKDNEGRLIQKWWRVVRAREQEYYYIKYATTVLRVIAWIILVLGVIGSLVWGITTGGIEGGFRIVIGMVGSFLAWLLLLAARELLKLFMDVKENTGNTAERATITKKSR